PGHELTNVIPDTPEDEVKLPTDIKDLPQIAYDRSVKGFTSLLGQPTAAQHLFKTDTPAEAIRLTHQFNTILWGERQGKSMSAMNKLLPEDMRFKSQAEYDDIKERGMDALGQIQGYRAFDLNSKRPVRPEWAAEMDRMKWFRPDGTAHE